MHHRENSGPHHSVSIATHLPLREISFARRTAALDASVLLQPSLRLPLRYVQIVFPVAPTKISP